MSNLLYEYIQIFVCVIFFDANIFRYSFVSKFLRMSHSDFNAYRNDILLRDNCAEIVEVECGCSSPKATTVDP